MTTREELVALADELRAFLDRSTMNSKADEFLRKVENALRLASRQDVSVTVPRVADNDGDEITVTLDGKELSGWSYSSDQERRTKMLCAREYVEGFCTGRQS